MIHPELSTYIHRAHIKRAVAAYRQAIRDWQEAQSRPDFKHPGAYNTPLHLAEIQLNALIEAEIAPYE